MLFKTKFTILMLAQTKFSNSRFTILIHADKTLYLFFYEKVSYITYDRIPLILWLFLIRIFRINVVFSWGSLLLGFIAFFILYRFRDRLKVLTLSLNFIGLLWWIWPAEEIVDEFFQTVKWRHFIKWNKYKIKYTSVFM